MSVGVGVIGLGFMGATHIRACRRASEEGWDCSLVAVSDADPTRLTGEAPAHGNIDTGREESLFDPNEVRTSVDPGELITDERVDLVVVSVYTDMHVELAMAALAAGKHVLVEKPLARSVEEAAPLVEAARASNRLCVPAMCMRFWPGWTETRELVESGAWGGLRSLSIRRIGARPAWASTFYGDEARSGGAMLDLHIHDADFVMHAIGRPDAVFATGSPRRVCAQFLFEDGPAPVAAEGAWVDHAGYGFRMGYTAEFEGGVLTFDLARDEPLYESVGDERRAREVASGTGYDWQMRAVVDVIKGGRQQRDLPTAREGADALAIIEAERASFERGQAVGVDWPA